MLLGRQDACERVLQALSSARQGNGGALVITGPAGIGKTALMQYARDHAEEFRVLNAKGTPTETDVPYAGLSRVLTPLLPHIPALPEPQAAAVKGALAIGPPSGGDVFPVYAGTLALLAAAAEHTPTMVSVDDCQWWDTASLNALLFAVRRLHTDPVLTLFTFRTDPTLPPPPTDLPTLELEGLDSTSAAALIAQQAGNVTPEVADWLLRATGGNPLALLDLPTFVPPTDLAILALGSEPAPVGPVLSAAYGNALSAMPAQSQQAVLIATMLEDTDIGTVQRALNVAGLSLTALEAAEDTGLLNVTNGALKIRHPLVRSAVLQAATPTARRGAHLAAAEALNQSRRPNDQENRIWHLAKAAAGPDEPTAELLEQLAQSATDRAGYAAACMTYTKAAQLSDVDAHRVRRLLAAAETSITAGLGDQSAQLLQQLDNHEEYSPSTAAAIDHLRGRREVWSGDPSAAAHRLQLRAQQIRTDNPRLAVEMAADATVAAVLSGRMTQAADAAALVADISTQLGPAAAALGDLFVGGVQAVSGSGNNAKRFLDRCRPAFDVPHPPPALLQQTIYLAAAYSFIDALQEAIPIFQRAITAARHYGAIGLLPFALTQMAVAEYRAGAWTLAYAHASEALTLADDSGRTTDRPNALVVIAMIDAARGREQGRQRALTAIKEASAMGAGAVEAQGFSMLGLLDLTLGRPSDAIPALQRCGALAKTNGQLEMGHLQWAAELIESQTQCGRQADTTTTINTMRENTHPAATTLNQALLARSEALVATDNTWEDHFHTALTLHGTSTTRPFEHARTHLLLGERLRRQRRRKDARIHLSAAWETFSQLGADPWAQRTAREIQATGTTAPGPVVHRTDLLTTQELQVALTISTGATNREAADTLFLSQKTVEFHLSSIYRRLGLRSRSELAEALADRMGG